MGKPKILLTWKAVKEASREDLEKSNMAMHSLYQTANSNRYRRSKNLAMELLRLDALKEQKQDLLGVIDYYKNFIDFRKLNYGPKRIIWHFIACLDVWDNIQMKVIKNEKLYLGVMRYFDADKVLKKRDADFIRDILTGKIKINRPWAKWEDEIILSWDKLLIYNEGWGMRAKAYEVGRTVADVREHFKNAVWKKEA